MLTVLSAALIYSADIPQGKEVLTIDFIKDKKAPVVLKHKVHVTEHKVTCKECHHKMEEGKPMMTCGDCHLKVAEEGKVGFKDAMHKKCQGCHEKKGGSAPVKSNCKGCHVAP